MQRLLKDNHPAHFGSADGIDPGSASLDPPQGFSNVGHSIAFDPTFEERADGRGS